MEYGVDILYVEHSAHAELLARLVFKREGIAHVHFARDGEDALDFLLCNGDFADRPPENPRVVFLDLELPLMDGFEVLRQIRGDVRTSLIPVVVLTSSDEDFDIAEAYSLGANSYIVKAVDFDEFSDVVRHVADYWLQLNRQPTDGAAMRVGG